MPTNCIFAIDGYLALGTSTPSYGDKLRIKQGGNTQYAIWLENNTTLQAITLGILDCVARIQTDYAAIGDIPLQIQSYTSACMYFKPAGGIGINTTSPVGKLDVSTGGNTNIVISNDSTDTGYNIISLNGTRTKGSYAGIAGGGTGDNKLYLNSGVDVVIQTGASYTERMRITCCGAMYMSRVASDITFGDNVGGMYVRQNGNGAATQEELRIFGRNISFTSHTGTRYLDVTSAGNIGIGTCTPSEKLHLYSASAVEIRFENSTISSYLRNQSDNFNFYINGAERMRITSAGCVGIGTTTPSYRLHVNGTFYAAGSSQDYKQSICNYNTDSCMFMKLKPVTYQYKEEYCHLGKELKSGTQIGLIAEEVAETYPELAILVNEEENKVVRNVDYEKLSVILLSEVQKLRREVDDLKHK